MPRRTHDDKINQDIYFVNEHCYNTKNSIKILGERGLSCRPEARVRGSRRGANRKGGERFSKVSQRSQEYLTQDESILCQKLTEIVNISPHIVKLAIQISKLKRR